MNSRVTHSRCSVQKQEAKLLRGCRSKVRYLNPIISYTLLYVFFNLPNAQAANHRHNKLV